MSLRRAAIAGVVGLAVAAALAGAVRYLRGVEATLVETARGAPVTVRFFKDPVAVGGFTAETLDGRTITAESLRGKVTVVNFWATWCPPCRAEIPDLIALQDKYRDHVQVIGVSEDEGSLDRVKAFVAEHRFNYPVVMATPELERIFSAVYALPTSFVLDTEGRIVQKHVGLYAKEVFEREARTLAGLEPNATIERVEPEKPVGLENAAQLLEIPGVDLARLSPDRRAEALQRLNADGCTCGCGLTIAKCRVDDPACGVSLPAARKIVDEIAAR